MSRRKYSFYLDEQVDHDVIEAINHMANGGAISKTLLRIIYGWHKNSLDQVSSKPQQSLDNENNENFDLVKEFNNIFD